MNVYLAQFKEWFAALAPRERTLVSVGAVFTVFAVLYLAVWEPLDHAHSKRAEALESAHALANRLEAMSALVQSARASGDAAAAATRSLSLLAAVDQASKSGTLSKPPTRLQPEGDAEVKVWLEGVTFDGVVRWIAELETRYGITAQTVEIEKQPAPGVVNARLSLVRP